MKRHKTQYPGVYYRETDRLGGPGKERIYYIVFKKNGRVYEEKVGRQYADDMTPARAARIRAERIEGKRKSRKEIREEAEAARRAEAARWPLARLWQEYSAHKPLKGLAQDRSRYERYLKPALGDKEPHEITPLDIDRLRLRVLEGKSIQTVKLTLSLLRRIVNYGVQRGLCRPLSFRLEMPRVHNLKTEDLSPEQLARLLEAIDRADNYQAAAFMKMALFTGMRRSELFRLKWEDIDFHRGFIHLRNPKGGADQKIPLNEAARQVLETHPRLSPYVFPGRNGGRRVDITKQVNLIKKEAGLPDDFRALHGLRHVYASTLASSGLVDLYTLAKLLTHKSTEMTKRYAHLRDDALKRAAALAADLLGQAADPVMAAQKEETA